jgi:hypothetical protein
MSETYSDPVAQLLTLGDPRQEDRADAGWRDYLGLGLTANHIPDLVRMALDEDLHGADADSAEVWAPVHAWRALGQLRAESAAGPLLPLLARIDDDDDEWVQEDLPQVFEMIGPEAIQGLRDFLAEADHGAWARVAASESLAKIAERFPASRERIVAIITDRLRCFADQERVVNGFLVCALCDLKAVESAAVIEQAFAARTVDLSVMGDWEEAQILLGLLEERVTPEPNFLAMEFGLPSTAGRLDTGKPVRHRAGKQKKAKRKQAKASRRRNRRR